MPAIGDIIKITSCKELFDQQVCNVFYYAVSAWTGNMTIEEALEAWNVLEYTAFAPIQVDDLHYLEQKWENLTVPTETAENIVTGTRYGLDTSGEALPTHDAIAFRLNRTTLVTRHGQKRIGGVAETYNNNGNCTVSGAALTLIEGFLSAQTSIQTGDLVIDPVIVGRDALGAYDLTRINPIASTTMNPKISTQLTRKFGRGS